jgi:hypothetical protein
MTNERYLAYKQALSILNTMKVSKLHIKEYELLLDCAETSLLTTEPSGFETTELFETAEKLLNNLVNSQRWVLSTSNLLKQHLWNCSKANIFPYSSKIFTKV